MNLITSELSAHRAGIKKLLKYEGLGVLCWLLHTPYIREPQTDTAIDSIAKIWQWFVFMLQLTCNMGGVFLYLLMWLVVVSDKYLGCLPAPPRLPVFFFFFSTPLWQHCGVLMATWPCTLLMTSLPEMRWRGIIAAIARNLKCRICSRFTVESNYGQCWSKICVFEK